MFIFRRMQKGAVLDSYNCRGTIYLGEIPPNGCRTGIDEHCFEGSYTHGLPIEVRADQAIILGQSLAGYLVSHRGEHVPLEGFSLKYEGIRRLVLESKGLCHMLREVEGGLWVGPVYYLMGSTGPCGLVACTIDLGDIPSNRSRDQIHRDVPSIIESLVKAGKIKSPDWMRASTVT